MFLLFVLFILFPTQSTQGAKEGLLLCGNSVIGSLFPFMVLSRMLVSMIRPGNSCMKKIGNFFHVSPNGVLPLILGMLCGYPMGAKTAADLCARQQISKKEASYLLAFCNNCGPAFAIAAVGSSFFGSTETGVMLFVCHVLSACITGSILRLFYQSDIRIPLRQSRESPSFSILLTEAIKDSCLSMLNVAGVIVVFSAFFAVLKGTKVISVFCGLFGSHAATAEAVIFGLFEITSGLKALSGLNLSPSLKLCLAEGILSFGGLSVFCQAISFAAPHGIKTAPYLIGKTLSAFISMGLFWCSGNPWILCIITGGCLLLTSAIEKPCKAVQIYCKCRPENIGQKKPKGRLIQSPVPNGKQDYKA